MVRSCVLDGWSAEKVNPREPRKLHSGLARPFFHEECPEPQQEIAALGAEEVAYQTRQELAGYMGWPLVQAKALPNSSKFCTVPLTRQRPGE